MEKYLEIGKIVNTHGVKGELKVIPLTNDPERYDDLKWAFIDKNGSLEKYDFESVKYYKGFVFLKLMNINTLEEAETLKNLFIKIDRQNAVKLNKDEYFICDLIGCEVFEITGNKLGDIKDILTTGSNDVYIVKNENKKEILIPALKSVVLEISIENRKIIVQLPEGLVDNEV